MISPFYRSQVDLLLQVMPHLAEENCFALKGGTAINLFIWDMPRLSVDIDLTYLPFDDRTTAMKNIEKALHRIKERIEKTLPNCKTKTLLKSNGEEAKLTCQTPKAQVKIEVNTVMRGHIFPPKERDISETVENEFSRFVSLKVLSLAELFGGKICAALDRQHPRDLFDIQQLFAHGGLSNDIRQGFLMSLLSSPRPIHEMIRPNFLDQSHAFKTQFSGMSETPFSYVDYELTRKKLLDEIHSGFSDQDRQFLVSFKTGEPDWSLFPHDKLKDVPAIQWKLFNIQNLKSRNQKKHAKQLNALQKGLLKQST